ncbi:protein tyrosine phosphatase [Brachybacterium sp. EF45031]|uniref:arsenate reductase/protein-tyrosine-phosphatase family protein n=1 Tax=Brachybacterium sillae TaxID=2810536 RepID=UPI00217DD7F6|nr:protein tyrosine phosphatase [Brachybacterium sillae]MCS6711462.1 protein tyrosine phosphatase [Brachybacterium sillae]
MPSLRVLTVCTGNVCRSPAAAVMLRRALHLAGLEDRVEVASAGTSWESEGHGMDPRIELALSRAGFEPPFPHVARAVHQSEIGQWDLVLAMTQQHAETIRRQVDQLPEGEARPTVALWRQFDPVVPVTAREEEMPVPDPWYSGQKAFDRCVLTMERSLPSLVLHLRRMLRDDRPEQGD